MIARRFFRFRLRTLLLAILVLSVLLTWLTSLSWQQQFAVKKVESLGGQVTYGDSTEGWLVSYFPALYRTVTEVNLGDPLFVSTQTTDKDISELMAAFPDVERISLESTLVTDGIVEVLKENAQLNFINLCSTKVTEAGLKRLRSKLPNCDAFIQHEVMKYEMKETSDFAFPDDGYYLDLIAE